MKCSAASFSPPTGRNHDDRVPERPALILFFYTVALFLSAFLAFSLQPMVGRMVLPLLGGAPAVWNTCMVFYQVILLGGYAYSHFLTRRLRMRNQVIIHMSVLMLPLLLLPISLAGTAHPAGSANPTLWLLGTLFLVVAPPFFAVTTTAPLLQRWFVSTRHKESADPYFLYAASNLGSLLALLAYPFLLEWLLPLTEQSNAWSVTYGLVVVLIMISGAIAWRGMNAPIPESGQAPSQVRTEVQGTSRTTIRWVYYAFLPSSLLLGVTQYISTDIAVIPLFWVIPLALYLLTFVLVFSRRPMIPRDLILRIFPGSLVTLVFLLLIQATSPVALVYPVHLITFFLAAMICHGELVRSRPPAEELTRFYLWIAVGGALGGLFNALLAPVLFTRIFEYPLVLILIAISITGDRSAGQGRSLRSDLGLVTGLVALIVAVPALLGFVGLDMETNTLRTPLYAGAAFFCYLGSRNRRRFGFAVGGVLLAGLLFTGFGRAGRTVFAKRSFYGVSRVIRYEQDGATFNSLIHGNTRHGLQNLDEEERSVPILYYHPEGPAGDIMRFVTEQFPRANIGVIGLGSGAMAAYGTAGQEWTFYEIDPVVMSIASDPRYFSYLADSEASWEIVLGDGRLSIESAESGAYDLIIVDAYGSDAIPVHTITREAVEVYIDHLTTGGLLAFHISNIYIDLEPVLGNIARSLGYATLIRSDDAISSQEQRMGRSASIWVVLAIDHENLASFAGHPAWQELESYHDARIWTDDYSNLLSVIHWE
ncbi:fused MFS/spermidine synthase [Gemmatimonadota bacterium]